MSRIEEALRRAGRPGSVPVSESPAPDALEAYPQLSETDTTSEAFVTPSVGPEPTEDHSMPTALAVYPVVSEGELPAEEPVVPIVHSLPADPVEDETRSDPSVRQAARADLGFNERLVIHERVLPVSVEQYRRVAAILHHLQVEKGTKVIMVASAQPGEGKTLTAANLALTLSESYRRRVLLIDADLRRPALDAVFRVQRANGLSDVLRAEDGSPLRALQLSDCLSLLPGGKPEPDPMAGLTSGRMRQVVEEAALSFDWVVLDTPPVALLSDAHLLAAMAEAVVLVVSAGRTPLAAVQRAIDTFGRERIVGVLLNRVDEGALKDAHYYHSRYAEHNSGRRRLFGFRDTSQTTIVPPVAEVGATE